MNQPFQEESNLPQMPEKETPSARYGCLIAVVGLALMLLVIFLHMQFSAPGGRKTCIECGSPIEGGTYCWACGVHCRKCGLVTSDRKHGYCSSCYKEMMNGLGIP